MLSLFGWAAAWGDDTAPAGAPTLDFRKIISEAKKEVFPALIFVKPIVEGFESGERKQNEVFGSGVVISGDGYAITNYHVIDKAVAINVVLWDKRQVSAQLVGSDRDTDLALLKLPTVSSSGGLPFARFAATQPAEGDFVMALGSPYGFQRSISLGIISNAQRYIGFETEYKYNIWLQTDAAINPGNSGGPLINTQGEIVGINTLGMGGGLGFSIPAPVVRDIVERLKHDGKVMRAYTGLRLQALKDFHSNTFIDSDRGVLITGVEDGSPAAATGLRAGDILLELDHQPMDGAYAESLPDIWRALAYLSINKPVEIRILRGKQPLDLKLTPQEKGKLEGEDFDCHRWGMTVKEINKYRTPQLHYMYGDGIYIQGVKHPGDAEDAGLRNGDIVVTIDKQPVKSAPDARKLYDAILADGKREKKVTLEIKRDGLTQWIVLNFQKNYDEE
jgi:serine protease Do